MESGRNHERKKVQGLIMTISLVIGVCLIAGVLAGTVVGGGNGAKRAADGGVPKDDGVKMIIVGFRHGHRNPTQFLKNDTTHTTWAWEGLSQLTTIGKKQAFALGKFLRDRYGNLIDNAYFPNQIKAYTSSAERCQMTLQSVMAGLYTPEGRSVWNPSVPWQPVPYEINDPLLRMYNIQCPTYKRVYQSISDDSIPDAFQWLQSESQLIDYVVKHSGLNGSLSDLADVADNLSTMKLRGAALPKWVTKPDLAGYPPNDLYSAIMQFAEAHQIMCADDLGCSRIMAGLWLDQILETLKKKSTKQLEDRRAHFYAAHTETVLSLIRLLYADNVAETPPSAGFILEYSDTPQPRVRFLFHHADPENPDRRLVEIKPLGSCKQRDWCPLGVISVRAKQNSFGDWQQACELPKCPL